MTPFSFIDCSDEGNAKTLFIVRLAYRLPQYCSSQPRQTNTQNVIKFYQLLIPIFLHDLPHTPHSRLHQYRRKKHERVQHLDEKKTLPGKLSHFLNQPMQYKPTNKYTDTSAKSIAIFLHYKQKKWQGYAHTMPPCLSRRRVHKLHTYYVYIIRILYRWRAIRY